jgi:hypothetical protein
MTAAAIKGCFSDFKLIRTRSVCQIVIEVPLEQADAALAALGGLPRPEQERWIALARIDLNAVKKQEAANTVSPSQDFPAAQAAKDAAKVQNVQVVRDARAVSSSNANKDGDAPKERTPFHELSYVQQVAIKCTDDKFSAWMSRYIGYPPSKCYPLGKGGPATVGGQCAQAVRDYCRVTSRSEIIRGTKAGDRWLGLLREYEAHR